MERGAGHSNTDSSAAVAWLSKSVQMRWAVLSTRSDSSRKWSLGLILVPFHLNELMFSERDWHWRSIRGQSNHDQ